MAKAVFTINDQDMLTIKETIASYEGNAEQVINDFLMNEAAETFESSIIDFIPVSKVQKKNHARDSKPLRHDQKYNLELIIRTKTKYNYLYFPQSAEGTSKGKTENDFVQKGIDREYSNVINQLIDKLQNNL